MRDQDQALKTEALDVSSSYQLTDRWRLSGSGRVDARTDNSAIVPATQAQGERLDIAAEAHYDSKSNWTAYGFTQATAAKNGSRDENNRLGGGGSITPTKRVPRFAISLSSNLSLSLSQVKGSFCKRERISRCGAI